MKGKTMKDLEALKKKHAELGEEIKKLEAGEPSNDYGLFDAKGGETHWLLDQEEDGFLAEEFSSESKNTFRTEAQADAFAQKLDVILEIYKHGAREFREDEDNWSFWYDHSGKKIRYCLFSYARYPLAPHYPSKKAAQAAVKAVGEERVKRVLFNIT